MSLQKAKYMYDGNLLFLGTQGSGEQGAPEMRGHQGSSGCPWVSLKGFKVVEWAADHPLNSDSQVITSNFFGRC